MCFNVISLYLFKRRKPVEITLGLVQVSLEKVDLRRRSVTVGLWLRISWHDEYLIWNVTDYDETSIISLDSKDIWIPDFVLGNFLRPFKFSEPEHLGRAEVRNNGHVTIWPNQEIEFGIEAAITSYPFDTQDCLLMIFTWSYPIGCWPEGRLLPPLGNFADIPYLKEQFKLSKIRDVCTLSVGALS